MKGTKRWLRLSGIGLLSLAKAAGRSAYNRTARKLAVTRQRLRLEGLQAEVTVYRDERGVPHVEAKSLTDVYRAQGYVTAQDRLWQMDMSRRLVSGQLAEILGAGMVKSDRLFRTLSLRRSAEASLDVYSEETLGYLESYCAGVNAYLTEAVNSGNLPPEFLLLGYEPSMWTPLDTVSIGKLLSHSLSQNLGNEAFHYQLGKQLGEAWREEVLPAYPEQGPLAMPKGWWQEATAAGQAMQAGNANANAGAGGEASAKELLDLLGVGEATQGSNGWVVSGRLTESGKPLLANDPHIDLQTPSTWCQAHLIVDSETEPLNVIGVTLPGVPGIVLGHNDKIAWGVTNNRADVQDLFVEQRDPEQPARFRWQDGWEEAERHLEIIRVKGRPDVEVEVLTTRHGPIVSEVLETPTGEPPADALALQWSALLPAADLEAFLAINRAEDWVAFRDALRKYRSPVLNFLFAAQDGTIACRVGGSIPIRAGGDGGHPVPGWTGEYEWTGFIPFEELPETINPDAGYIVSANQKVADASYPYFLTDSWDAPYRAWRIEELLREKETFALEDMVRMQGDQLNGQARRLLPHLLPVLERADLQETERLCIRSLQNWNCVDDRDAGAPLIYHFFWWQLSKRLFEEQMGPFLFRKMVDRVNVTDETLLQAANGMENGWVRAAGGWEAAVTESFQRAVALLRQRFGDQPEVWRWGAFHRFDPQHPIGNQVPQLGKLINPQRGFPIGGSNVTVCLMTFQRETGAVVQAAPWRMVVDLSDLSALDLNAPGQSGEHLSPWYDDQSPLFVENRPSPQRYKQEEYRNGGHRLVLRP